MEYGVANYKLHDTDDHMSIRGGLVTGPGVSKHERAGFQPLLPHGGDSLVLNLELVGNIILPP